MYQLYITKIDDSFRVEYRDNTPDIFVYNSAVKEKLLEWGEELKNTVKVQGFGSLYNKDKHSYCCLGILGTQDETVNCELFNNKEYLGSEDSQRCLLQTNQIFSIQRFFSEINDSGDFSFSQIAEIVQKLVEKFDTTSTTDSLIILL